MDNMNNENEFNFNSDNSFKKSYSKPVHSAGFGKTVFVPFLSGILGATIVVGACFGVPSIKQKLVGSSHYTTATSTAETSSNNFINIAEYSNTSTYVAEKVLPSVVGITVTYQVSSFFGGNGTSEGTGSGIIISEDGYIVTNNHVISSESSSNYFQISEATGIKVNLYGDSESYDATVVGTDSYTDLAVLKIEKNGLNPAVLGNSNDLKVGEFVMAIGNPLGMEYSVTSGIVSAVNRDVTVDGTSYNAIQTDAAINSGNSGGALVNSKGEVIGINTLKLAGSGIEGIGFAIPISSTTSIIDQLIEFKSVKRPYIGISGSSVDSTTAKRYNLPEGVNVEGVEENSPAAKAGIQQSDIITKIEGKEIKSVNELNKIKYNYKIGDTITLTIVRNSKEMDVQVTLVETPENIEEESTTQVQPNVNQDVFSSGSIFDLFR